MERENELKLKLQDLQKQLGKKQLFEEAVASIRSLLKEFYPSASPSLRNSFYSVISRVATILKTRYTAPGFWNAGLGLFLEAEQLVPEASERQHLRSCIAKAQEQLSDVDNQPDGSAQSRPSQGYLFEGHLTVDPEPPQPQWLVQENFMSAIAAASMSLAESSQDNTPVDARTLLSAIAAASRSSDESRDDTSVEDARNLMEGLESQLADIVSRTLEEGSGAPKVPPASKKVVAELPVIDITEEILANFGQNAECAICKEDLVIGDKMQELPCKHTFHPPCLKPWLDEHNSCPICRHELQTDDHAYESWKEREKEAEEERKGAANAVRGGEYMYV